MVKRETDPRGSEQNDGADARRDGPPAEQHDPGPRDAGAPAEVRGRVYRRVEPAAGHSAVGPPPPETMIARFRDRARKIAPTISPLIIGFTLLLALISLLGYLSVQRLNTINLAVLNSQRSYAAKLQLLLNLRLAVTRLDNEARARHEAESRRELKPPFDFRVSTARDSVNELLPELENILRSASVQPTSEDQLWFDLRRDLLSFVEVTRDLRRFSLEGRGQFDVVDAELYELLKKSTEKHYETIEQNETLQQDAVKSILNWSVIALLVGAIVAAGTIWEVQRRFRQMRRSMFETRRERTFTSQLLEGMVSAVAAIDENDRLRSANAAFFRIFPRATIGASVAEKFAADDAMKMLEAATAMRASKSTYRGRWVCRQGDDAHNQKTFDVYSSPLAINGDRGQIVTLVDATEVSEYERGLRRSESLAAVGQATAQVAHEIRNPLGSIRLGVSMLRDSVNDAEALNTIELVERGINHLNKLVVDVTQFSRQKALERSPVDLHELLDRSLDLVSESIKEKRTPVEKSFSSQRLLGHWDGHQLRQVFVNVISNAIDASRAESPITISTKEVTLSESGSQDDLATKRYARIVIADQGKGIDPTKVDRIFEPFFSTKKRGTGLGLAIVKQIVEQHEGRMSVDSQAGKGTRFIIDLPL
jgi:signal transduction histidine kinase